MVARARWLLGPSVREKNHLTIATASQVPSIHHTLKSVFSDISHTLRQDPWPGVLKQHRTDSVFCVCVIFVLFWVLSYYLFIFVCLASCFFFVVVAFVCCIYQFVLIFFLFYKEIEKEHDIGCRGRREIWEEFHVGKNMIKMYEKL